MAKPSCERDGLDGDRELAAEIAAVEAGDREQAGGQDRRRIARRFEIAVAHAAEQARRAAQETRQHDAAERHRLIGGGSVGCSAPGSQP